MRHLFIVDPLPRLLVAQDTSIAFMREAARRGHGVWTAQVEQLAVGEGGRPHALAAETFVKESDDWYELGAQAIEACDAFDVVWMRKDPPVDLDFVQAVQLLALVAPRTLVVNDPFGLLTIEEKLFVLRFPDLAPPTIVSRDRGELLAFCERLGGEMILKPIGACGGEGVFHIARDDRNLGALLESATRHGTRYQIAQRYQPEIRQGDKRVIVVEGEPIGAVLRVPRADEARANFHAGGSAARTELTPREREICARIGPELRRLGIVFAGIDVIGGYLTEVNVTSPTGIREINALENRRLESDVLDAVEARARTRRR
jgi:glutathione synthase